MRAVCFSPEKRPTMKSRVESSSPVKISNYQIRKNKFTDEDEVHINKRTKLENPSRNEITFECETPEEEKSDTTNNSIQDIITNQNEKSKVNITGRLTKLDNPTLIQTGNKTLTKQECTITDESGSIRLVLWEDDIKKIDSGNTYKIFKAMVKTYAKQKYITLNKQTTIELSTVNVQREDTLMTDASQNIVECPAEAVEKVTTYLSCSKCNSSLPRNQQENIIKCTNCGMAKLKSRCKTRALAKVVFNKPDEAGEITLTIFDDKLSLLHGIYKTQSGDDKDFTQLSEDDLTVMLLTVNAKITYNNSNNRVLSIS